MTATNLPGPSTTATDVSPRHAGLMRAASALGSRTRSVAPEAYLAIAGAILMPVGIMAILIGWYGSAHTGHVYQQNDYLISGGILGLGLTFVGGFLYFAYWMTRQLQTQRQTLNALGRIEAQLASQPSSNGAHPRPDAEMALQEVPDGGIRHRPAREPLLVATSRGSLMHRPDCPVVAGRENVRQVSATESGLRPCQICSPLSAGA